MPELGLDLDFEAMGRDVALALAKPHIRYNVPIRMS